jgi:Icc-related predicted phosphoesterase
MPRRRPIGLLSLAFLVLAGCAGPVSLTPAGQAKAIAADFRAFYPAAGDPDPAHDVGLLRPRFGLPAITKVGGSFVLEVMARNGGGALAAALVPHHLSDALTLSAPVEVEVAPGVVIQRRTATPTAALTRGGYDLYLASSTDAPARAPRAVWLRDEDPAAVRPLTVIQLSDVHVGKGGAIERHLAEVIAEVNAIAPDLVLVSGDIADNGDRPGDALRAGRLLQDLQSPVMAWVGNHDLGFGPRALRRGAYHVGWPNFARPFHPYLLAELDLGGWRFVGFDSGASAVSPFNVTRGLAADSLAELRETLTRSSREGLSGVVLFSHAPTRARLTEHGRPWTGGPFGHMRAGAAELEQLLLTSDERVIHLSGHTHWNDLFEARGDATRLGFYRREGAGETGCARSLPAHATLINTQSATHAGLSFLRRSAAGWGFARLDLNTGAPRLVFQRHGVPGPAAGAPCPD